MAKTNFVNGTIVTPEFLNTIYGQSGNGGHIHDGADADGRARKINLDSHTEGTLHREGAVASSALPASLLADILVPSYIYLSEDASPQNYNFKIREFHISTKYSLVSVTVAYSIPFLLSHPLQPDLPVKICSLDGLRAGAPEPFFTEIYMPVFGVMKHNNGANYPVTCPAAIRIHPDALYFIPPFILNYPTTSAGYQFHLDPASREYSFIKTFTQNA